MARASAPRAVFVDKDGTLVVNVPNSIDPKQIALTPGAGPALARLRAGGYDIVLVSNQSGVAHGLFTEDDLDAVWRRLADLLAPYKVALDGIYYCPHDPAGGVPRHAIACRCRKPQPGLLWRAAVDRGYELACSWLIGDILDDVEAGNRAGCRTILLDVGNETEWRPGPGRHATYVAHTFEEAARRILRGRDGAGMKHLRSPPWMQREV